MAAPPDVTLGDLSGNWIMNRELSDDTDAVLALQGVGWWKRQAIKWATVTLSIKQYTDTATSLTHIDIDQTATGGIKGTQELRTLDWVERSHSDDLFGDLRGRSRWVGDLAGTDSALGGPLDGYLVEGWLAEGAGPSGEASVQSFVLNEGNGWTAEQIWGMAIVDGTRYYTRRVVVIKGDTVLKIRLVYNFQGRTSA